MLKVSVVIPCFNEDKTIRLLLEALYQQTFPRDQLEVLIADGMSQDHTRDEIAAFQQQRPDLIIRIVDNPPRTIPSALNRAIAAAQGEYIVRLDAHSIPQANYLSLCVQGLEAGAGDNVGGVWDIQPGGAGWQARAIALAAAHPIGVGDARYRYGQEAQKVDTVPFGAFRRSLIERIGPFDESLLTNEDYEFNARLRQAGGVVWMNPDIRSTYFARSTYQELARQYWRYGYWKVRMLRRYPGTLRWRQALPPAFVASLLMVLFLSIWIPILRWVFVLELASYALVLLGVGIQTAVKKKDMALLFSVPAAIAVMHLAWGSAFLWSMITR